MSSHILTQVVESKWAILPGSLEAIVELVQDHSSTFARTTFHQNENPMQAVIGTIGERINGTQFSTRAGSVGILHIDGPIIPRSVETASSGPSASLEKFSKELKLMEDDPKIDNIVISFDTPGGLVTGVSEFADFVRSLSKPVTGFVYGYAASAGYWIASATTKLYGSSTAEVGSIGTVAVFEDRSAENERRGVKRFEIVSNLSPNKRLDPQTDAGRQETLRILDQITELFVSDVARGRGKKYDDVMSSFGQGSMFIASEAVDRGMLDGITTLAALVDDLNNESSLSGSRRRSPQRDEESSMLTAADIQRDHPEAYATIFGLGVSAEQERLKGIEALSEADPSVAAFVNQNKFEAGITAEKMALKIFNSRNEVVEAHAKAIKAAGSQLTEALEKIPSASSDSQISVAEKEAEQSKSIVADLVAGAQAHKRH